jgi:hypothetical protein
MVTVRWCPHPLGSARARHLRRPRARLAARHAQGWGEAGPLGAQPPRWVLEPAASNAADAIAFRLQELGALSRAATAGREEISASHNAALRMEEQDKGEKLLREKDAELDELRALLRSKPASAADLGPDPDPAPAPADQSLAHPSWPAGWVE